MSPRLFDDRPPGAISVVEPSLSRWYARRARSVFFATAAAVGLLAAGVLVSRLPLVAAVLAGGLLGVVVGFVVAVLVRVWPVLRVLWWWSLEFALVAAVVAGLGWLAGLPWSWLAVAVPVLLLAVAAVVGPVRRRLVAWAWCVIVRHRLRMCFAEFIRAEARTRPMVLPLILGARPTPAGERVWVWLRPGLDLADLDGKTGRMAVACWAAAVRVVQASTRYAALVRVDVSRRDPLTGLVVSPLATRFGPADDPVPVSPGVLPAGLDLDDVPEPVVSPRNGGRG